MQSWVLILVLVVVGIIMIVSLVYASEGSTALSSVKGYSKNPNTNRAHQYLVWISVIGWLLIVGIIIALICLFIFGIEIVAGFGHWIVIGLLFLTAGLTLTIGIMSAIAAYNIRNSSLYTTNNDNTGKKPPIQTAYHDTVISASAALGSLGLMIIGIIIYFTVSRRAHARKQKAREILELEHARRYQENEEKERVEKEEFEERLEEKTAERLEEKLEMKHREELDEKLERELEERHETKHREELNENPERELGGRHEHPIEKHRSRHHDHRHQYHIRKKRGYH